MIPKIVHRTLPEKPRSDVGGMWKSVLRHTQGWEHRTYQSPRRAEDWPLAGPHFGACHDRAMESNLVRFEALLKHGGVYLDSDVSLLRPLDDLLGYECFVGWESDSWLGMAVVGAIPGHPAIQASLDLMIAHVRSGAPRSTCPRIVTPLLRDRGDVTKLQPKAFYPLPYGSRVVSGDWSDDPDVYAIHHWHASWM